MQCANDKVNDWLEWCALHEELTNVQYGGYNLTLHPSSIRGTFPGLSPFRVIHPKDIVHTLLELPSITVTSLTNLLLGAAATYLTLWSVNKSNNINNIMNNSISLRNVFVAARTHIKRSLCVVIISVLSYCIYVRQRRARLRLVSGEVNCSSSPRGPCNVTNNVIMITNSHAGTHADSPYHFIEAENILNAFTRNEATSNSGSDKISTINFSDAHYNGNVIVLDFSSVLHKYDERAINTRVMREALDALPYTIQSGEEPLWRLMCITRHLPAHHSRHDTNMTHNKNVSTAEDKWESTFAHFTVNAIEHLLQRFPRLLLLATDAPSVDAPNASPIREYVHGSLFACGVAIVENINGAPLYPLLEELPEKKRSEHPCNPEELEQAQQLTYSAECSIHQKVRKCDSRDPATFFLRGVMSTVFNPMQNFRDSRGCSVLFFPSRA